MKILAIRPAPPGTGARALACFDVEITPELRLYRLQLHRYPDGRLRTYPPEIDGRRLATFTPAFGEELSAVASAALEGTHANSRT